MATKLDLNLTKSLTIVTMTIRGFKIRPIPSTDLCLYVNCDKKNIAEHFVHVHPGKIKA